MKYKYIIIVDPDFPRRQNAQILHMIFVQNYLLTKSRNRGIIVSEREVITMTNKQLINAWDEFLSVEFGCYADENGNRPCDNGALCDRCSDEKFYKFFRLNI